MEIDTKIADYQQDVRQYQIVCVVQTTNVSLYICTNSCIIIIITVISLLLFHLNVVVDGVVYSSTLPTICFVLASTQSTSRSLDIVSLMFSS